MFKSTHNLQFLVSPHNQHCERFDVGTMIGHFTITENEFIVYSLYNPQSGNGHLEDALEWIEYLSKDKNKNLLLCDAFNRRFKQHLIEIRGFLPFEKDHLIKYFKKVN